MEIDDNFILKGGKHKGKSIAVIKKIDYQYISWAMINAPGLLKAPKVVEPQTPGARKEVPEESSEPKSSLQPNLDFLNQINEKQF